MVTDDSWDWEVLHSDWDLPTKVEQVDLKTEGVDNTEQKTTTYINVCGPLLDVVCE